MGNKRHKILTEFSKNINLLELHCIVIPLSTLLKTATNGHQPHTNGIQLQSTVYMGTNVTLILVNFYDLF